MAPMEKIGGVWRNPRVAFLCSPPLMKGHTENTLSPAMKM